MTRARPAARVTFLCLTSRVNPRYLPPAPSNHGLCVELKDIKAIIDLMRKNDLSVFEMEKDGFRLKLQKGNPAPAPVTSVTPVAVALPAPAVAAVSSPAAGSVTAPESSAPSAAPAEPLREIVSPMVGTFYRSSAPDGPPFVEKGSDVNEDTVVCIIEAMKVMNEIKAETGGVIAEIVAENGKPVQFGQVLYRVR